MRLRIAREPACAAVFIAAAARVFTGVTISLSIHNGAWLAVLLGGLLALPGLLGLWSAPSVHAFNAGPVRIPAQAFFLLVTLLDCVHLLRCLTDSASYLALDQLPPVTLLLPLGAAILWCVFRNGDAIGYSAEVWLRILPLFLLIVLVLQFRSLRPAWLFPLTEGGFKALFSAGLRVSAWQLIPAAGYLLTEASEESDDRLSPLRTGITATAAAASLVVLWQMMVPRLLCPYAETRIGRLDVLLTNGRAPLYMQFPLILVWFVGLLQTLCFEAFTAAALLQRLLPGLNGRAAVLSALAAIIAGTRLPGIEAIDARPGGAAVFFAGVILYLLTLALSPGMKGAKRHAHI